jgi:hypothetical protein
MSSYIRPIAGFLGAGVVTLTCQYVVIRAISNVPDSKIPELSNCDYKLSDREKKRIRSEYVSERLKRLMFLSYK